MTTAIMILGAAVWPDGPSPTLTRRVHHGATLYHKGCGGLVVACGGVGRFGPSEAEVMARILRDRDVPDSAIRLEDRSRNTAQNIAFALPILEAEGITQLIIVSDSYHLPRARLIARRHGVSANGAAPSWKTARLKPQIRGWLREIPAMAAVLLRIR
ncbi:YdcF family protein [Gymnodinialimonas sp. 2305UL16-5]|uniref:YdcF family protein n=1 Tax=Gymnodinialimonas mytili TaxID=3126503 RepID=UPI0030B22B29